MHFGRECILCQKHIFLQKKQGGFTTSCDKVYNFTEITFSKPNQEVSNDEP